mgnify:FL=1
MADDIDEQLIELQNEIVKNINNNEAYDEFATRFSSSVSRMKNAHPTPQLYTHNLKELTTCKFTLKSIVPTLLSSTRPW